MCTVLREAVLGLGSNLGDRIATVLLAADELRALPQVRCARLSPLYETVPVGGPPQGDFINAAVALETTLTAEDLLGIALAIERRRGRVRRERFGPRTLDIDVLWIHGEVVNRPWLEVPHPRLYERAFALRPLLDVAPDAQDPQTGELLSAAMALISSAGIRRLGRADGALERGMFAPAAVP
jgi:2-amino-4-hydroxy-6-hydroxymethyldihydropteridine diphosphokinase